MCLSDVACKSIKMSIHTSRICFVLVLLTGLKFTRVVEGSSQSFKDPKTLKLIWLPSDKLPPKHISPEVLEGPSSQLPYINVSPSRAPKQLLGAR